MIINANPNIVNVSSVAHATDMPSVIVATDITFSLVTVSKPANASIKNTTHGDRDFIICMKLTLRYRYNWLPAANVTAVKNPMGNTVNNHSLTVITRSNRTVPVITITAANIQDTSGPVALTAIGYGKSYAFNTASFTRMINPLDAPHVNRYSVALSVYTARASSADRVVLLDRPSASLTSARIADMTPTID